MKRFSCLGLSVLMSARIAAAAILLFPIVACSQDVDNTGREWMNFIGISQFRAIAFEGDDIWAATDGGIVKWSPANGTRIQYTSADGLPGSDFYCVAIHEGVKWFGGPDRVCRFDGETWEGYPYPIGFGGDHVSAIAVDHDGVAWFGANFGAIRSFDGNTWHDYDWVQERSEISSIVVDSNNVKWFATGSGIIRYDNGSIRMYTEVDGLPGPYEPVLSIYCDVKRWVYSIAAASDGTVYAGTVFGLSRFDGARWETILGGDPEEGEESFRIQSMVMDSSDALWYTGRHLVRTDGSWYDRSYLTRWDGQDSTNYGLGAGYPITLGPDGAVWAVGGRQVSRFDGQTWEMYNWISDVPRMRYVSVLALDGQGSLWIGTRGSGLVRFDGTNWTVYTSENSVLPCDDVTALAVDVWGNLWIGTGRGLVKFDGDNWTVYTADNSAMPHNNIRSLATDLRGNVWIGLGAKPHFPGYIGGLVKFDGDNWTVYTTDNSPLPQIAVSDLACDTRGNLWIVTGFSDTVSVSRFDGQDWTVYDSDDLGMSIRYANALTIDEQGNLWIGQGSSGVAKFEGQSWTVYSKDDPNSGGALAIDKQGNVWIGGWRGLTVFDGENCQVYHRDNSGLSYWVSALVIDTHGNLWIGGDNLTVYREGGVILTDVEETPRAELPSTYFLSQNYPNPFNTATKISFSVPAASHLKISIYTVLGQLVRELGDQTYGPGVYQVRWDGTDRSNRPVASGVYLYRITTSTGATRAIMSVAKKMVLLR